MLFYYNDNQVLNNLLFIFYITYNERGCINGNMERYRRI